MKFNFINLLACLPHYFTLLPLAIHGSLLLWRSWVTCVSIVCFSKVNSPKLPACVRNISGICLLGQLAQFSALLLNRILMKPKLFHLLPLKASLVAEHHIPAFSFGASSSLPSNSISFCCITFSTRK
jgi:hypothetical protein